MTRGEMGKTGDLISRADAICEVLVNDGIDNIVDRINALPSAEAESDDLIIKGAKGIKDGLYNIKDGKFFQYKAKGGTVRTYQIVPSADAVCEDTQTEERARFVAKETELANIEAKLENAEKRLQGACTANFVAEQLDRLRNMTDEERWDFFVKFFSPSAEQVTSKLNNPCDSLLTDDSAECKEQKSKLESADAVPQSEQYKKGFEDAKRAYLVEYARESRNMRKRQLEVMLNAQKAISAEAVQLKQTDTLIIADALRYLAQDTERHLSDRTRADALREQILKYGASRGHSVKRTRRKERAMTGKARVCDKAESEHLDKIFPHEEKSTWYDITEMLTYCDVNDSCEDCPRYADDCDGEVEDE